MTEPSKPIELDPRFFDVSTESFRVGTFAISPKIISPSFQTTVVIITPNYPRFREFCAALERHTGQRPAGYDDVYYPISRDFYEAEPLISAPPDLILVDQTQDEIVVSVPTSMYYDFNAFLSQWTPEMVCENYISQILIEFRDLRPRILSLKEFVGKFNLKLCCEVENVPPGNPNLQPTQKEPLMQKKQDLEPITPKITRLETVTGDTAPIDDVVRAMRRSSPFTLTFHGDEIGLDDPSRNIVVQAYPVDRSFGALYDQLALVGKHHILKDKKTYLLNIPMTWYDKQENVPVMLHIQQPTPYPTICVALPHEDYLMKFKEQAVSSIGNKWAPVALYSYLCQVAKALKDDIALELSPEGYMKACIDTKLDLAKVLETHPKERLSWDMEQPLDTTGTLSFDRDETRRTVGLTRAKAITIVKGHHLYMEFSARITMLAVMDGVVAVKDFPSTIKCRIPLLKSKFKHTPVDALVVLFVDRPEPLIKVTLPIDAGTGKCMTGYDDFLSTEETAEDYLNTVLLSLRSIIDKQKIARMLTGPEGYRKTAEEILSDYRHPAGKESLKEELGGNNKETKPKAETPSMSLDVDGNDIVKKL